MDILDFEISNYLELKRKMNRSFIKRKLLILQILQWDFLLLEY